MCGLIVDAELVVQPAEARVCASQSHKFKDMKVSPVATVKDSVAAASAPSVADHGHGRLVFFVAFWPGFRVFMLMSINV
ncbi:hypothetical protein PTKIN_Ptkin09bG0260200 [Pterospermum kingtungense]